ncbi:MAG: ABC transporter substrate-binding protein [Rhodospirillales bacterium]|nr:ABC transporter substrate-binding protein [Rhodospirillales bacterium]
MTGPAPRRPALTRRTAIAAGAATLAMPAVLRAEPAAIKIGLLHPVTGPLAFSGNQCRTGGTMAIAEINAAGGIKSMGGAKLEAVLGDTQLRPEIAAGLVDQMSGSVAGFTGCFASGLVLAATQAAAKYNLPFCVDSGIADNITTRGLTNTFRLFPAATPVVEDAVLCLSEINKSAGSPARSAILVHENSEFGTGTAKVLAEKLPGVGIKVLDNIAHPTPTRDFSNIVLRIQEAKPDLVIMTNYLNEYILLARTLVQQRVKLVALFSVLGGGFGSKFATEQPQISDNIMDFNNWINPKSKAGQDFRKKLAAAKVLLTFEVPFGYLAVKLMADAIEHAGSTDRKKVIDALANSTFYPDIMPYGPTHFVNGQNQGAHAVGLQIQKGAVKVVWPGAFAEAHANYPRPKA